MRRRTREAIGSTSGSSGPALPDFRCQWTAQRGAEELIDAYRRTGLTYEEFQGVGRYTRLAQLKRLLSEGAVDERLRWSGSRSRQARRHRRRLSATSELEGALPDLPRRVIAVPELLEQDLVPKRVHALPEGRVLVCH